MYANLSAQLSISRTRLKGTQKNISKKKKKKKKNQLFFEVVQINITEINRLLFSDANV